jgi:2-amino-4-hydroxy-6-hydroxymethyldihydropteridine diphosphokinase
MSTTEGDDAYIGLGANLGDRAATIAAAIDRIAALPGTRLLSRSSFYESAPLDAGGGDYLNAVVRIRTVLEPLALLDALQAIEAENGRERPYPNAPRSLDLDLLLHGSGTLRSARLQLPHPRMTVRAFVLQPLQEIAPDLVIGGEPIGCLLEAVTGQRIAKLDR